MSSKGARVSSSSSIPDSVKNMIQNIREITAAHDDEIYATLKDCSMDPNETVQRLLNQDTFHEVKRKRDKKKENSSNKEPVESRWKPSQGRGGRVGRGNFSSRYVSNDTGVKNSSVGKENPSNQASLPASRETKTNETTAAPSSTSVITNGPSAIVAKGAKDDISKSGAAPHDHLDNVTENSRQNSGTGKTLGQLTSSSSNSSTVETQVTSPGAQFSSSDPVLVPSQDLRIPGAAGTIKREVGSQRIPADQISVIPFDGKTIAASEIGKSSMEQSKFVGVVKNQQTDATLHPSSVHGVTSVARPSSNHSSRSQLVVGPPKVGLTKEWKPKPTNSDLAQGSFVIGQSEFSVVTEGNAQSHTVAGDLNSKEASTKLQRKLEELHISDSKQVIIPNYLHVPGAEKVSFCFGSFDAISLDSGFKKAPDESNHAPPLETSQSVEETEEQTSSFDNVLPTAEEQSFHNHPQSPEDVTESLSPGEHDVSSAENHEYAESKAESDSPQQNYQYPTIHTSPGYGIGLMPTIMGNQQPPFEGSESQAREVSRVPSFVVPQPIDPVSYYAQFYRSPADGDGRISPFHATGVATKYNGNVAVLPSQTSQPVPEGGNSVVISTAGPNSFVTQPAGGLMPSSIAVTQQPVPVFRQPFGIPIPHYPHNYMPYGPYFSPYFVPPFHQSLGNSAYLHQPQAGSVYQAPPGPSPKYSPAQYKDGTSSVNSTSVGVASSYVSYAPSTSIAGNSTTNEDLTAQQFKESNVYIAGQQQSEGSAAGWIMPPGRDMSGVQANSFYNIPSHGQVAFPHHQPGLGPFTGIYHTAQAVSATSGHPLLQQSQTMSSVIDLAGPAPNVYQQPQHAQVAWPNNNY